MLGFRSILPRCLARGGRRWLSDGEAFRGTVLVPRTRFPLKGDPAKDETIRRRTSEQLYEWQWENSKGPLFVLHDGPPYANGDLHMGHALNKIIKDTINRFHVLLGERVHYVPGWDCHGLPIEQKVLKNLGKDLDQASPITIRQEAEKYAHEQVASQMKQFKDLGIMAKWEKDTTYRTMDHAYEMRQLRIFQKMVDRGLIYRQHRPVHYSPSSRSALAESELDYNDKHVSHSAFVAFTVFHKKSASDVIEEGGPVKLLAWTTTPWTLTANMGIAVNPEMEYMLAVSPKSGVTYIFAKDRYDGLQDILNELELDEASISTVSAKDVFEKYSEYRPLFDSEDSNRRLPIIFSSHVTPTSGTGAVHLAPAHGQEDFELFRDRGMTSYMLCHVDGHGKFTPSVAEVVGNELGARLIGKEVLSDGSREICTILREKGVLLKVKPYKHRYPYDWKTDKPIIMMATSQWFADLSAIKEAALTALKNVDFYPPITRNRLEAFVQSRSEWCISRQRAWGVPIPALYHTPSGRAVLNQESLSHILGVLQEKGTRHWWDGPVEDFVSPSLRIPGEDVAETWTKGTDTMDVWFDSGTSWSMLEGLADQETSQKVPGRYADVCVEGSDQHRGWFQSQLLTAVATTPEGQTPSAPYGALITHGMVLDDKGKKMSKSLGNIVLPATIINGGSNKAKEPAYGTDVLRLWAATVDVGNDMPIGGKVLAQTAQSLAKLRNTARFMLGNLGDRFLTEEEKVSPEQFSMIDRYVMHKLYEVESTVREGYSAYNFPKVISALSSFTNITLSTIYFDTSKDILYCDAQNSVPRRAIITIMDKVLQRVTYIMAPIVPHLAEEIHQTRFPEPSGATSVFCDHWTPLESEWHNPQLAAEMEELLKLKDVVLVLLERARRDKLIGNSLMADLDIIVPNDVAEDTHLIQLIKRETGTLKQLTLVSQVNIVDEGSLGANSPEWVYTGSFSVLGTDEDLGLRVRPASLHRCPRCWTYSRHEENATCQRCATALQT